MVKYKDIGAIKDFNRIKRYVFLPHIWLDEIPSLIRKAYIQGRNDYKKKVQLGEQDDN